MNKFRGLLGGGSIGGELGTVNGMSGIQGGVSTANLHEVLSQKGLTTANLAAALGNVPAAAPAPAPAQPAQSSAAPKAGGGS
jgi:hypothetical protein